MMVIKSTVNIADKKSGSLKAVIPKEVVKELGIQVGDVLAWEIREVEGRRVAVIRKLE